MNILTIKKITKILKNSEKVVAFTGAGISTESGVPDFRSPNGLWEKYDPALFTIHKLKSKPKETWEKLLQIEKEIVNKEIKPNLGHMALVELEKMNILEGIITQNVDGLHRKAGNSSEKVIELHGNMRELECLNCKNRISQPDELSEVPPRCDKCGSIMKPAAVLFGEQLPKEALLRAQHLTENSDFFLVIGSSLSVQPAASFPQKAIQYGVKLGIINRDETPLDTKADVIIRGKAGQIPPEIVKSLRK